MEELTDEVLLQLLRLGNESALGAFYDRYGKMAYSLAYRMLGDVHAAEDAVQEAFINVWRRAGSFSVARGTARTWIMAVVHHRSIDIGRKRRGIAPRELPLELDRLPENHTDTWSEVSNTLDREVLRECLERIPEDQRKAIQMAFFDGYTQREIAELKGIPLGTVKGRICIGMEKLRSLLHDLERGGSTDEPR
jgi:RNA polymerase sigma-70 factor (ECF subfamily)